jgi:copper chaperone CopZ
MVESKEREGGGPAWRRPVSYDEGKVSTERIKGAIEEAGYTVAA